MADTTPLFTNDLSLPGMTTVQETFENEFLHVGYPSSVKRSAQILGTATDSGNTDNTSLLRKGLLMSYNRNGNLWAPWTPYTPNATTNNYYQSIDGVLQESLDLTGGGNRFGPVVTRGQMMTNRLIVAGKTTWGIDDSPYRYLVARQLAPGIVIDDLSFAPQNAIIYVDDDTAGAFALTDFPNGTTFVFTGANAVALTLPAPLPGLEYTFLSYGTADVVLTGATAGDIKSTTAADDTITLTEIGASVTILGVTTASSPAHHWITHNINPTAATNRVTVAT